MTHSARGKSWLRTALRSGVASSALIAGMTIPAIAQDEQPPAEGEDLIIVTGSRIPQPNLSSASPVTGIASDEFTLRGTSKVEDIVNTLPQAFAAQGSSISNGASGTATINLRGLGTTRTLVLIDGRRMPYGSAPFTVAPDVNQIPSALVDRVEVVTGGASAVYGSDAMSGVVNFIMKRDFEGLRFDGQFSFYQHDNNHVDSNASSSVSVRDLVNDAGFELPDDSVLDGFGKDFSVVAGANSPDGRGNITAYFVYHHNDEVLQGNRDYSACALGFDHDPPANAEDVACVGSSTIAEGRFTDFGLNPIFGFPGQASFDLKLDPGTGDFVPRAGTTYNFGPANHFLRPDERFLMGSFMHYEINKYAEVYMDLMYNDDRTRAQIAPSGSFFTISTLNCGNPLMSAQQAAAIQCTPAMIANDTPTFAFVGKRNVEGGNRTDDLRHTTFRGVFGVRGETGIEGWTYDAYGWWSNVHMAQVYLNDLSTIRMGRALDVVDIGGGPICRSTVGPDLIPGTGDETDLACVPWNLFEPGQADEFGALNYISIPGFADANTTQQGVNFAVTADLGVHGGTSPWAKDGIGLVLGAEYRRDTMDFRSDITFCDRGSPPQSDLAGQGGATCPVSGNQYVYEGFVEMRLPFIQDKQFIHDLTGEFGFRYSEYARGGSTHTWKLLGNFSPTEDIRFRGGWQRAVRAPNVIELFLPQRIALFDPAGGDPCEGAIPAATLAQCQNSGLLAAQYGFLADNPAGQYNSFIGGNPNLDPETADTYTVGAVLTPSFAQNLIVSVDYFDIFIADFINTVPPELSLDECVFNGDPFFCSLINRDAAGSLWITPQGFITATNINTGSLSTSGIDVQAAYSFDLDAIGAGGWGSLAFDLVGTYLLSLETEPLPGFDPFECAGFRGGDCGTPNPKWRHKFRAIWQTPIKLDLSVAWRYFSAVDDFVDDIDSPAENFTEEHYLDIAVRYHLFDNVALRAGVNNILDNDPNVSTDVGAGFGNGNTNPQVYDALGRYFFFSATLDF